MKTPIIIPMPTYYGGGGRAPELSDLPYVLIGAWILFQVLAFIIGILEHQERSKLPGKWPFVFPFFRVGSAVGRWLSK